MHCQSGIESSVVAVDADPWFDFRSGNASLCPWERHFTFTPQWGQAPGPITDSQAKLSGRAQG